MSSHSSVPKAKGFPRMWDFSAHTGMVGHSDGQKVKSLQEVLPGFLS